MKLFQGKSSRRFKVGITIAVVISTAALMTGCTSAASGGGSGSKANLAITFVPKSLGNPYFQASDSGGKAAIKSFGGTYDEVAPATASPAGQVSYINTLTQQRVGAIVISADDPQAPCSALNQARKAGIKVVTFDSDTNASCRDLFVNQVSDAGIAATQVKLLVQQMGDSGQIAFASGGANATNLNEWISLMKADLKKNYPKIQVVTTVYGNDDDATAYSVAESLVQSYPNLKGIIAPDSVASAATAQYLSTSQYKGKIVLTGLGLPSQLRAYIKDGTMKDFAVWNPTNLGYLAAYAAKALITKQITGKKGDTFSAGKLGKYTVGADGVVILGPPLVITASNVDDYHF